MQTITGGGSFSRQNIADINSNFALVKGRTPDVWVRPQYGKDTNVGSFEKPFATMAGCARAIEPGIVIGLQGVLFEEYSSPIVNDVTIVGYNSGQPRQATTSGVPNGGGATWLSPSGGTGSLLTVNGQAWTLNNLYFNNTATGATTGCVVLTGGGDPPLTADSAHTLITGCVFTGEANGVYFNGGPGFVTIANNRFQNFDSSADCAILTAAGAGGTGAYARILNNVFDANLTHIKGLAKANSWEVANNRFSYISTGVTTTTQIDFTGGNNNSVHNNYFDLPYTTTGLAAMFVLGTNDRWYFNEFATAVGTTIFSFGSPQTS